MIGDKKSRRAKSSTTTLNQAPHIICGGIADTYVYDAEHRLDHIAHADAMRTNFTYDGNGNVTSKHRAKTQAINIGYRNTSQADRQCTLNIDGVDVGKVIFTPNEVYTTVTKSIHGGETISLVIRADDVEATSSPLYIDYLGISATGFEAEDAALYGNARVFEDGTASQEHAVCQFGETTGDAIVFTGLPVPLPERYTYTWDNLNRMTTAKSYFDSEPEPRDEAAFHYNGAGWEIISQTVNTVEKTFSYGAGGELLTETVGNFGTRAYINAGLDNVLWSNDNQGTMYWLNDLNGTNYGLTDASGGILERQIYDGFGNKQLTYPNGDPRSASGYNNDVGFQGRGGASWIGANFRNRWYDPQVGRFFSRDPLGLVDGGGVYVGFGGNPVNNIDPMGTEWHKVLSPVLHYEWHDDGDGPTPPRFSDGLYNFGGLDESINEVFTAPNGKIWAVANEADYKKIIAAHNAPIIQKRERRNALREGAEINAQLDAANEAARAQAEANRSWSDRNANQKLQQFGPRVSDQTNNGIQRWYEGTMLGLELLGAAGTGWAIGKGVSGGRRLVREVAEEAEEAIAKGGKKAADEVITETAEALRGQARSTYREAYPKIAKQAEEIIARGGENILEIHHRVPLEYRGLIKEPNRLSNLIGLHKSVHSEISGLWTSFRNAHPSPTAKDVLDFALKIDEKYGTYYNSLGTKNSIPAFR